MENVNKRENALDEFLGNTKKSNPKVKNHKKALLSDKQGLIERVDKIYVTEDGRQLLREQY